MNWELEREAFIKASRQRSHLSHEEVVNLKAELERAEKELAVAKSYVVKWKDRALSALENSHYGNASTDPTCDEAMLRRLISEEVIDQLHKTSVEVDKQRAKITSLEIQNRTLLNTEGRPVVIDFGTEDHSGTARHTEDVDRNTFAAGYQREIDDFDNNARTHQRASKEKRVASSAVPSYSARDRDISASEFMGLNMSSSVEPVTDDEISQRAAKRVSELQQELSEVYNEIYTLRLREEKYISEKDSADRHLYELSQENISLKKQLDSMGDGTNDGNHGIRASSVNRDFDGSLRSMVAEAISERGGGTRGLSYDNVETIKRRANEALNKEREVQSSASVPRRQQLSEIEKLDVELDRARVRSSQRGDLDVYDELSKISAEVKNLISKFGSQAAGSGYGSATNESFSDKEKELLNTMISFMFGVILLLAVVMGLSMH